MVRLDEVFVSVGRLRRSVSAIVNDLSICCGEALGSQEVGEAGLNDVLLHDIKRHWRSGHETDFSIIHYKSSIDRDRNKFRYQDDA